VSEFNAMYADSPEEKNILKKDLQQRCMLAGAEGGLLISSALQSSPFPYTGFMISSCCWPRRHATKAATQTGSDRLSKRERGVSYLCCSARLFTRQAVSSPVGPRVPNVTEGY